jgi:transposase InsO family protein
LQRALTDNGTEFQRPTFTDTLQALGVEHTRIHAGRTQINGHVERLHRTILEECWRPAFARYLYLRYHGLQRELRDYLTYYNHHRTHTGRIARGAVPADLVYGARKMEPR